jgi:hypothetical protein
MAVLVSLNNNAFCIDILHPIKEETFSSIANLYLYQ